LGTIEVVGTVVVVVTRLAELGLAAPTNGKGGDEQEKHQEQSQRWFSLLVIDGRTWKLITGRQGGQPSSGSVSAEQGHQRNKMQTPWRRVWFPVASVP